ncbi:MAG: hypothetical protein S4CHLAM102_08650 [Chlamydiia bacterium]|nr:hypothetical protein [Chlamydiia bacterium]
MYNPYTTEDPGLLGAAIQTQFARLQSELLALRAHLIAMHGDARYTYQTHGIPHNGTIRYGSDEAQLRQSPHTAVGIWDNGVAHRSTITRRPNLHGLYGYDSDVPGDQYLGPLPLPTDIGIRRWYPDAHLGNASFYDGEDPSDRITSTIPECTYRYPSGQTIRGACPHSTGWFRGTDPHAFEADDDGIGYRDALIDSAIYMVSQGIGSTVPRGKREGFSAVEHVGDGIGCPLYDDWKRVNLDDMTLWDKW